MRLHDVNARRHYATKPRYLRLRTDGTVRSGFRSESCEGGTRPGSHLYYSQGPQYNDASIVGPPPLIAGAPLFRSARRPRLTPSIISLNRTWKRLTIFYSTQFHPLGEILVTNLKTSLHTPPSFGKKKSYLIAFFYAKE